MQEMGPSHAHFEEDSDFYMLHAVDAVVTTALRKVRLSIYVNKFD